MTKSEIVPEASRSSFDQPSLPRIGIRPTIDARLGGPRESLEHQTMSMARRVAAFLQENIRYPGGQAVQCIISERCIGGGAEAAQAEQQFERAGVGLSLTVTPSWCYGAETMDMHPSRPKAVWGFNGTERPGAVYLAAVMAAHNQKGLPVFGIYGRDVQEADDPEIPDDVKKKLLLFARAGLAVALMRGRAYLAMGGVSMGIAGSILDHAFFEAYLGMRVETVDMSEFTRRIEQGIFDRKEHERALSWVQSHCREGEDPNPAGKRRTRKQKDADWAFSVSMALIARDLMVGNPALADAGYGEEALGRNAIAAGFQGQRQWTDHFPNGDFMEAILNSSFDWNGIRPPYIVATENDALNGASMLFGYLLTQTAQIFADVRSYWSPEAVLRVTGYRPKAAAQNGFLHLINSGPATLDGTGEMRDSAGPRMKPFWEISQKDVSRCLEATTWHTSITEYFRGGGYSTRFRTRGNMPATICRLNLVRGRGPVLQIAEGQTIALPNRVHDVLDQRTNPTWPTTWFVPRTTGTGPFADVYSVMNHWGANHCALCCGHVGAELITLASMLRIPVYMHNVPEAALFRPGAWTLFGAQEPMGADFRACENFGPLYGKY